MDSIRTPQDLLLTLAGNGDPSAFSTLIVQYANAAYIAERNLGKSHKEALVILIPFIKSAYQDFIKTSPHKAFDVWYREYKKKFFSNVQESSDEVTLPDKNDFGNVPMADIAHFERILDIVIQRKYGKIKRTWKGRLTGQSRRLLRLLKTSAIIVSAGIVLTLFYYFLVVTKQQIIVTYSFQNCSKTFALPFSSHSTSVANGSFQNKIFNADNPITESPKVSSSLVHDTVIVRDTVRIVSHWKPAVPNKVSAATSPVGGGNSPSAVSQQPAQSVIVNKQAPPPSAIQGTAKSLTDSLQ
jgi:hypothetical protein